MTNFELFLYGFERIALVAKCWVKLLNDELSKEDFFQHLRTVEIQDSANCHTYNIAKGVYEQIFDSMDG